MVDIDRSNAYNTMSLARIQAGLHRHNPKNGPLFEWCYGHRSHIFLKHRDGHRTIITTSCLLQGDPAAGYRYQIGDRQDIQCLIDNLGDDGEVWTYIDDVTVLKHRRLHPADITTTNRRHSDTATTTTTAGTARSASTPTPNNTSTPSHHNNDDTTAATTDAAKSAKVPASNNGPTSHHRHNDITTTITADSMAKSAKASTPDDEPTLSHRNSDATAATADGAAKPHNRHHSAATTDATATAAKLPNPSTPLATPAPGNYNDDTPTATAADTDTLTAITASADTLAMESSVSACGYGTYPPLPQRPRRKRGMRPTTREDVTERTANAPPPHDEQLRGKAIISAAVESITGGKINVKKSKYISNDEFKRRGCATLGTASRVHL